MKCGAGRQSAYSCTPCGKSLLQLLETHPEEGSLLFVMAYSCLQIHMDNPYCSCELRRPETAAAYSCMPYGESLLQL